MTDSPRVSTNGVASAILLTIILAMFQWFGVIDWSWWWIIAPLWVWPSFLLALLVLGWIFLGLGTLAEKLSESANQHLKNVQSRKDKA